MKLSIFFFALLVVFPFLLQAQEINAHAKTDSTIKTVLVHTGGRYPSIVYTLNNEVLSNKELDSILKTYPSSADETKKFHRQKFAAFTTAIVSVTALIVGVAQVADQRNIPGSGFDKAPVPFTICLGALTTEAILVLTNNHRKKAIKAYNNRAAL